jgi:uncharacterized protein YlxW (UPF0749 family)
MKPKDRAMLAKLEGERDRLARQIEALHNEMRGLDRAIALYKAESGEPKERPKNVKQTISVLMEEAGMVGATVDEVVVTAKNRGIHLEKGTVASNLSRGRSAGMYDARDGRYFFRARPSVPAGEAYAGMTAH